MHTDAVDIRQVDEYGEIDLMEGDAIDQVEDFGEGWLYGRNERTGEIGYFPSSFCTQGDLP